MNDFFLNIENHRLILEKEMLLSEDLLKALSNFQDETDLVLIEKIIERRQELIDEAEKLLKELENLKKKYLISDLDFATHYAKNDLLIAEISEINLKIIREAGSKSLSLKKDILEIIKNRKALNSYSK